MKPLLPPLWPVLSLLGSAAIGLPALRAAPPAPDYELLFADEFDGDRVNERDWSFRTGPRTGTGIDGLNLARNVRVADGHLIVTAKHEVVDGRPAHTGGGLISRHRFGYGYYECRSQPFMAGRGVHTAFWQRGLGGPENNSIFEIDSHEIDSTQKIACNNLYVDVSTRGYLELAWPHRAQVPLQLPPDRWWTDAYEYTPDGVIFYDHGKVVARADFPDLVAQQNVWLTALNGVGKVDTDKLPGETRFDYFRFYARDYPGANLLANGGFEYNQDKVDLQRPVAWRESGEAAASRVVRGGAAHGDFKLRHEGGRAYAVTTAQTLQFIRNGDYELRARVRRGGGQAVARLRVSDFGGAELAAEIPVAETWTEVRVPRIPVTSHGVTVSIVSEAGAGDWLEVDEVQFMKPPRPGQPPRPSRSFAFREGDPIWQLAPREPIAFSGDEKFYFFGRNCGLGEAMTVSFIMQPQRRAGAVPIARLPKTGDAGWAVGLAENGDVFFRLGSQASHRDIVAPAGYREGVATRVTCVFDHGAALVYLDGVLRQRVDGVAFSPKDTTAPGRLGANSGLYDAVGDVTLTAAAPPPKTRRYQNYAGQLGDIRIYNRALSAGEVAALTQPRPVPLRSARASSTYGDFTAAKAIDGVISDTSRWTSDRAPAGPWWLELELGEKTSLLGVHVHTGLSAATAVRALKVQFERDGQWVDIPSATVANNQATALALAFDDAVAVRTDRLRLWIIATPDGYARLKEVVVWPAAARTLPALPPPAEAHGADVSAEQIPLIYLNQSGFNLGRPKRFTAPTLPDGTPFAVRPATGGAPLFSGRLAGHVGDFSDFDPADDRREFVVVAGPHTSVPFRIGHGWLERVTYQNVVNFMIDSRHRIGNERAVCQGSYGWRDDHHFGWELHTLVPQFLSNPSAYTRMPRQITYEPPADPTLWGRLQPPAAAAPDLVKLIHWGADVIVTQQLGHEMIKAQLAYFLYAWPWLKAWLPEQNYAVVRDYAFAHWREAKADRTYPYDESPEHDLCALKTRVGTTKGAYPPGFSIEPNLLLYAVAQREGRADAEQFFQAAFRQTEWIIAHLDWNDPLTTKGQRMSEWLTLTGLAHFLREYPSRAPAGLAAKINAWAAVVIRRAENLWDFRKLDDADGWTPMGDKPTMWNEPGNVVGLPAALLAAQPFVTDAAARARLGQLVWSHFDAMFGRNPTGRHFSYDAPREIEGVEHGWYSFHAGGIGRLAEARFVIDGSPKNQHFPYHPEVGNVGWTEGWVQFNTAFNISLAYLAFAETSLSLRRDGDDVVVQLTAPLNFDYAKVETAEVSVRVGSSPAGALIVTEDSANARTFTGRLALRSRGGAAAGDGVPAFAPGTAIEASYGFGFFARRATINP